MPRLSSTHPRLAVFDFDGTLTTRDTFPLFIRYVCGLRRFVVGFALYVPLLCLVWLGMMNGGRVKEMMTRRFFRGMAVEKFSRLCLSFAKSHAGIVRGITAEQLRKAHQSGWEVVIVSASVEDWVRPFFPETTVLGTKLEESGGRLTGCFATPNCNGMEKVRRLRQYYPNLDNFDIEAWGDSRGDKEMLALAQKAHRL